MHPIERLRYVARAEYVPARLLVRETAMALADFVGDDPTERANLLIACKRILDRQPASGPLLWLVAHVLGSPDPAESMWTAAEAIESDQTPAALAYALSEDGAVATVGWSQWLAAVVRSRPDVTVVVIDIDGSAAYELESACGQGHGHICVDPSGTGQALAQVTHVVVGLDALGPEQSLARQGAMSVCATGRHLGLGTWAVAETGVGLGERMYDGLVRRWHGGTSAPLWERPVEEVDTALFDRIVTRRGVVSVEDALRQDGCPIVPELF